MSISELLSELKIIENEVITCLFRDCKKLAVTINKRNHYPCCNDHKKGDYCMRCNKYTEKKGMYCEVCSKDTLK